MTSKGPSILKVPYIVEEFKQKSGLSRLEALNFYFNSKISKNFEKDSFLTLRSSFIISDLLMKELRG